METKTDTEILDLIERNILRSNRVGVKWCKHFKRKKKRDGVLSKNNQIAQIKAKTRVQTSKWIMYLLKMRERKKDV